MKAIFILIVTCWITGAVAQQVPDSSYFPVVAKPEYRKGKGPIIALDEAHFNFHTLGGRYQSFGKLLGADGYTLVRGVDKFTAKSMKKTRILAIANALTENDLWRLPTLPAFTDEEVEAVKVWVEGGGRLLLIADHMPCAGGAAGLAAAFGFTFHNAYALKRGPEIFSRGNGNLYSNSISNGRNSSERVDSIRVFTGQAIGVPEVATVFTALDSSYSVLFPEVAGEFSDSTKRISGAGLAHGAYRKFGKGRVVVVGEAAMFSAQLAGPERNKMGMNHPTARNNPQLLLNIIHWLDGKVE